MAIAEGIRKTLAYKKETSWGTVPVVTTGGQILRRVTGMFNLKKDTYQSEEIRSDFQMQDYRHGFRKAEGSVSGEFSPGTFAAFIQAALGRDFTAGSTTGALTNVTAAVTTGASGTFTRAAGSFLTDGFKVGDVVRWTGWATTGTPNNAHNFLITALTATVMTVTALDGVAIGAKASGDSVTGTVFGKKTFVPTTGHTDDSFTFEEWSSTIAQSEVYSGNKVNTVSLDLPASGLAKIDLGFMGKDLAQTGSSQFFTSPSAETSSGIFASVNGLLLVGGVAQAIVTGVKLNLNRNMTMEAVVGSNVSPDIFEGRCLVDGEFTAFYEDATFRDYFDDETEVSLVLVVTTANTAAADFVSITLPRIKINGADKDDGEKGVVRTYPFQALRNASGGTGVSSEQTTISIQDALAA